MSLDANEFDDLRKKFMDTCKANGFTEGQVITLIKEELAVDVITYIQRQLNDVARMGKINGRQYALMLKEAEIGLFELIYIKHYPQDTEAYDHDPLFISATNLQRLLFNRVLDGRDRELALKDMESKRPLIPMSPGGR